MVDPGSPFELSEGSPTTFIFSLAHICHKLFEAICDELYNLAPESSAQQGINRSSVLLAMQDGRARFMAWGINIAAFRDGRLSTSLDYRLRDAPEIRGRLLSVLGYLQEYLNDASQIIRGNKPNQMWNDGIDSDSDSEVAIEEQTEKATSDSAPETSELEELCLAIGSSNSNLMKLSMLIRDSSNRDDYLKAASRYSNWDPNPYIGHVREKYGSARGNSDWLVDRLGKSILRRRQFLRYREEHHGKLTGDWGEILNEDKEEKSAQRIKPAKTVASTKATTFVVGTVSQKDGSDCGGSFGSQTSYEATEFEGDGAAAKLTVPPPPKMAFEDIPFRYGEPFRCPYCYMEQEVTNKAAWKKHVFRDLKPYVCTFPGCGMRMFRSRNEWFAHELQCHRREWVCQYCQHKAFGSAAAYSTHLESSHPTILEGSQLESLLLQSEEPVDKISSTACPLCDEWEANLNNSRQDAKRLLLNNGKFVEPYGTTKQFRRHLGRHMEQLALFALPIREGDGLEDDSSDDDDSEQKSENPQNPIELADKGPYTIKCICGLSNDDGNTVYCETCDTWQHIECFYPGQVADVSREDFHHSCADCKPRALDQRSAKAITANSSRERRTTPLSHSHRPRGDRSSQSQSQSQSSGSYHDDSGRRPYVFPQPPSAENPFTPLSERGSAQQPNVSYTPATTVTYSPVAYSTAPTFATRPAGSRASGGRQHNSSDSNYHAYPI